MLLGGVNVIPERQRSALLFSALLLLTSYSAIEFASWEVIGSTDEDGDGLTYGLEFYINTQPQNWDSDGDGLPDGWEWQYGLNPLSSSGDNGSTGDPDGDSLSNLNEYLYSIPNNWDNTNATPTSMDNGVWWNGTVPVSNWDEESAMQLIQGLNSDGADEDPMGNICLNTFDDDHDGLVDNWDNDKDGDADCSSDDDDGDGIQDEDPNGWDTDGDGMPDGWEVANNLDPTSNSNNDGWSGDPDGDGLVNLYEYVNPSWDTRNGSVAGGTQFWQPGPNNRTNTESPCNPVDGSGPNGCAIFTAEVDGITFTDPNHNDSDFDGLNDSYEALVLLTDPTAPDTDGDGIPDGIEVNGSYGNPPQASDPRNNNTDGDIFDDGEEDTNSNGIVDDGETDPTRIEDGGDFDGDEIPNWQENMSCTQWDNPDTDGGGVNDFDESLRFTPQTDPCMSTFELYLDIIVWDPVDNSLTVNNTTKLNPEPLDWRHEGTIGQIPPVAFFEDIGGNRTPFRYSSIIGNNLREVSVSMPSGAISIVVLNGSWCWDVLSSLNEEHCDDDYLDSDLDGLADWEENEAYWGGYLTNPNLFDTDGDSVGDLDEILGGTDPLEPCSNNADTDGDGLNDWFEVSTGCPLEYGIPGGNSSLDNYTTLLDDTDSDNGGISDYQEYIDGTNPQDNPSDDLNPLDSDGDGINDASEQLGDTDWLDPDSDGDGIPDGMDVDPLDPTDGIQPNQLYFIASNNTEGVDYNQTHYWRWHTYDSYNSVSWGVNTSLVGYTQMSPEWSTTQGVAHSDFWDNSALFEWTITMQNNASLQPEDELIAPYNAVNYTGWIDTNANLSFSNFTRDVLIDAASISELYVTAPQVMLSDVIRDNSTAYSGSNYATDLRPGPVTNNISNIAWSVVNETGFSSTWDQIEAIQQFLINGNNTINFLRNYNGSGANHSEEAHPTNQLLKDTTLWIVEESHEADCDEFATVFAALLRGLGLPARKVTGFSGGTWVDNGFEVYGSDFTQWVEVHLQTNANQGELDLGWVPFEACPAMSLVEVVEETYSPESFDRDYSSGNITLNGTLQFVDNSTVIDGISMDLYLVTSDVSSNIPGSAALTEHLVASTVTNSTGFFSFEGQPSEIIKPGFGSLVILTHQSGYVGNQAITFPWVLNITDDANISITNPLPILEPMLGAGVNNTIQGLFSVENVPSTDPSEIDNLQVLLNYTTVEDGTVNLIAEIGVAGYFEFLVPISDNEPIGLVNASLAFLGWHQNDLNNATLPSYHIRSSSLDFNFNITPAPDLTISIEGIDSNSSILDINEFVFLNGTVESRSTTPQPLNGNLSFQMRRAGTASEYVTLNTWYLNESNWTNNPGEFALVWEFNESIVTIPSGPVEIRFTFDAEGLFAIDQEISESHGIRSYVEFSYILSPIIRGDATEVNVQLFDHTGTSVADFPGNYTVDFNGSQVWNISNPETGGFDVVWIPPSDMLAGDYSWVLNYSGSVWLNEKTEQDLIQIRGRASATVNIGENWTHLGGSNWISGIIQDNVHLTPILNNNTSITLDLLIPSDIPSMPGGISAPDVLVPLTDGWVNTTTGAYNLSFNFPINRPSSAYSLRLLLDFNVNASWPITMDTYFVDSFITQNIGIQSEFVVEAESTNLIAVAGSSFNLNATITDVADQSEISNASVDLYFDWGGPNQVVIDTAVSNSEGFVQFNPTIVSSTDPGFYDLRIHVPDDITDALNATDAGRWLSNDTFANLTVQVNSLIQIDSIPSEVTAGQSFIMSGRVIDDFNNSRNVTGPMGLSVFFLGDNSETLIESFATGNNGSFIIPVPTDPLGNGVTSGIKTVVVSLLNGSTPFYLTSSGNSSILVRGVTRFTDHTPIIQTIADRGSSINFGARLTEFSDNDRRLGNFTVSAKFHDTWMIEDQTLGDGLVNFTFDIPHNHPLGLIDVTLWFNGSSTLHSTSLLINKIIVRSPTNLTVDSISENPIAGGSFNISGSLLSSNDSGIIDRDGNPLATFLTFEIDGDSNGFVVSATNVSSDGSWNTVVTLGLSFPRGSHNITAIFTPTVNYYGSSSNNGIFDSRGYSQISILDPADLDPDRRVTRGESISLNISLSDNAGDIVDGVDVNVLVDGVYLETITTDAAGLSTVLVPVSDSRTQGPLTITTEFLGISGTTGLMGDSTWTRVIVLAPSEIEITNITGTMIAGESISFSGILLDEHGNLLTENGNSKGGIIHINIDGIYLGIAYTTLSNASTGIWNINYNLPLDTDYGSHTVTARFLGGFTWVDPMGQGDPLNPEYYLPSSVSVNFNVSQTSQVVLTTIPGEVDRNELLLIEGMLTDGAGRILGDRSVEVSMNNQYLTGIQVDSSGNFSVFIPVPPNMKLGPRIVKINYAGEEFILASNSTTVFTVFGPTYVAVEDPNPVAIGDEMILTGNVKDNLPDGWLANHTLEVFIDGILVGLTSSDDNGQWEFRWIVTDFIDIGTHSVTVLAPEQGYYRSGSVNTNVTVAFHSSLDLQIESISVTRGESWNFTGRLYDSDSWGSVGLEGRTIVAKLDGIEIGIITTGDDGNFIFEYETGFTIARGGHDISFTFEGEVLYLPIEYNMTVYTRADIEIEILWQSELIIRSDENSKIEITGRVLEIGGEGNVMDNLEILLLWNDIAEPAMVTWTSAGNFDIVSPARSSMPHGEITLVLQVLPESDRYLNGAEKDQIVHIRVPVIFDFNPDEHIIREGTRIISGNVTVRAKDTNLPVEGISITSRLVNESKEITESHFESVKITDGVGVVDYKFIVLDPIPDFYDKDYWGELGLIIETDSQLIDPQDRIELESGLRAVNLTYADPASEFGFWQMATIVGVILILVSLVGVAISIRRRRLATLDDLQNVFSYTAELLAAGDEVREAIFNCYESLCQILMRNGFLRRDFETVREFEMAIRKALPISEQALIALDRIFEEARYSSHRLGEGHRQNAQLALQSVLQEIDELQEVPERDSIDMSESTD